MHSSRTARIVAAARQRLRGSLDDRRGTVALVFALLLPVLLITALGGIELNQVLADKKRTQDVADSAALMGAAQLGVTPVGADQRAQAFAQSQLADVASYATVTAQATIGKNQTMSVAVDTQRASFFGSLFPPGGFHTHVTSTAQGQNTVPLCVLGIASTFSDMIHITGTSQLQAGACLVHSNEALTADPAAAIQADANEAGTIAMGPITNTADALAPNIKDPFAALSINPATCSGAQTKSITSNTALGPGIYGSVNISGNSTVTFTSGNYYFCGTLTISGSATVSGTDVVLVFDKGATLSISGSKSTLNLSGRQSGPLAGFVLVADRNYTGTFSLQSDFITGLTGTVYVPTATLAIQGTAKSGATSPWTVIAAENLTVNGGAQLVINANYAISNVPVPVGVGNQRGNVQLMQ